MLEQIVFNRLGSCTGAVLQVQQDDDEGHLGVRPQVPGVVEDPKRRQDEGYPELNLFQGETPQFAQAVSNSGGMVRLHVTGQDEST